MEGRAHTRVSDAVIDSRKSRASDAIRGSRVAGTQLDRIICKPLTGGRWKDFERLLGERGGWGGCWCMYWRLTNAQFKHQKGEKNRKSMKRIIDRGETPGILAYLDGSPVGWCAVAPRQKYVRLEHSRLLRPIDDAPVWSISCLLVHNRFRRCGVSVALLQAAVDHVRKKGGRIVEGYPVEPRTCNMPDAFAWTGIASAYRKAGFIEMARRSAIRPIMRRILR
jgi:GNAT superfamily N-acetyltransferase